MRWLILLLLLAGVSVAGPPMIYGPAGLPSNWYVETINPLTGGAIVVTADTLDLGAGTVGDADIYIRADSGAVFNLALWNEGNDQLEFPVPVQVAELDIVEAGDAVSLGAYTRYLMVTAGSAGLGPTAPSWLAAGTTSGGLGFNADAEQAVLVQEIPDDWDGASDILLKVYWTNQPGDAVQDTETVEWNYIFRSIVYGTEGISNGTAVALVATYVCATTDADGETYEITLTLDYDGGVQDLTAGDVISGLFSRDTTTDTYSGEAIVIQWELAYTSVGLPNHN